MTGFGRGVAEADGRTVVCELKSVNHRFLDVAIRGPRALNCAEDVVRAGLNEAVPRGHVDVNLSYQNTREDAVTVAVDTALALQYHKALDALTATLGCMGDAPTKSIDPWPYTRLPDVLRTVPAEEDTDTLRTLTQEALTQALQRLCAMRQAEGARLWAAMQAQLAEAQTLVRRIAERAPGLAAAAGDKLRRRIAETLPELSALCLEERLAVEIALLADKLCVDEELTRLQGHFTALENPGGGREIDFLLQECNREVNTIGSKANDSAVTTHVIALKGILEKLREQAANIA